MSKAFDEAVKLDDTYVMHTYGRLPVEFVDGSGAELVDVDGKRYLDFLGGIGSVSMGHANPTIAAALSAQAASKSGMEKVYQAVVCLNSSSYPLAVEGMKREVTLTDWLGRDRSSNTAYIAAEGERDAKRAELVFRTVWIREGHALLEIRLHTGRHHQIRVQMAHAGMPLLGDRKYSDPGVPVGSDRYNYGKYKTGCDGLRERGSAARNEGSYDSGEMQDVDIHLFT